MSQIAFLTVKLIFLLNLFPGHAQSFLFKQIVDFADQVNELLRVLFRRCQYSLAQLWPKLCDPLLATQTEEQVIAAFENYGQPYAGDFVPRMASDILALIRDPSFPKRPKAQIGFLADSLAGRPNVEFRTSRDICVKERARQRAKSSYKIVRKEFYVECSCGYKGPARDNACRKCGAGIPFSLWTL